MCHKFFKTALGSHFRQLTVSHEHFRNLHDIASVVHQATRIAAKYASQA
jgi:hypothetical protein